MILTLKRAQWTLLRAGFYLLAAPLWICDHDALAIIDQALKDAIKETK